MNHDGLCCSLSLKFQLSPVVMIPLLDRPPVLLIAPISILSQQWNRQVFLVGRSAQQWIMPSLPHWSLFTTCPSVPTLVLIICTVPVVPQCPCPSHERSPQCYHSMCLLKPCLHVSYVTHNMYGGRGLAVLSNNCVVQVWVFMPHYTKSKAQSFLFCLVFFGGGLRSKG